MAQNDEEAARPKTMGHFSRRRRPCVSYGPARAGIQAGNSGGRACSSTGRAGLVACSATKEERARNVASFALSAVASSLSRSSVENGSFALLFFSFSLSAAAAGWLCFASAAVAAVTPPIRGLQSVVCQFRD